MVLAGDELNLAEAFADLRPPRVDGKDSEFVVTEVAPGMLVGRGSESRVAILFVSGHDVQQPNERILLSSLSASRRQRVRLSSGGRDWETVATVLILLDPSLHDPFVSFSEGLLRAFRGRGLSVVWPLIVGMTRVFQARSLPASQSLTGLIGEVLFVYACSNRNAAIEAWASEASSRFDFVQGDLRLDVKTTRGRIRRHHLRLEQARPAGAVDPIFISFCVDFGVGRTLRSIIDEIRESEGLHSDNEFKLEEKLAHAGGRDSDVYEGTRIDVTAALASARVYQGRDVPKVTEFMAGVSEINFVSDFSLIEGWVALDEFLTDNFV